MITRRPDWVSEVRRLSHQDLGEESWTIDVVRSVRQASDDDLGTLVVARAMLTLLAAAQETKLAEQRAEEAQRTADAAKLLRTNRTRRKALFFIALAFLCSVLSPVLGLTVRVWSGHLDPQRMPDRYGALVGTTDLFVGGSVLAAAFVLVLGATLFHRHRVTASILSGVALALCGVLFVHSTAAYGQEDQKLITALADEAHSKLLAGMCNGGVGSSGEITTDEATVEYALNGECNALVLWSGSEEIRRIAAPGNIRLDLHVVAVRSHREADYVAAASAAKRNGGAYTLVIFGIDDATRTQSFAIRAPDIGQGYPILGENALIEFERSVEGVGMVTAVDPDTGRFVWNVRCPKGWDFLSFGAGEEVNIGRGYVMSCTRGSRLRVYTLDIRGAARGKLLQERDW